MIFLIFNCVNPDPQSCWIRIQFGSGSTTLVSSIKNINKQVPVPLPEHPTDLGIIEVHSNKPFKSNFGLKFCQQLVKPLLNWTNTIKFTVNLQLHQQKLQFSALKQKSISKKVVQFYKFTSISIQRFFLKKTKKLNLNQHFLPNLKLF